jgi:coproporphyrinogen III oxidase
MQSVQDHIANWLVGITGGQEYHQDLWNYHRGSGGGRTRVWEGKEPSVLEKAGVNFSMIEGAELPKYVWPKKLNNYFQSSSNLDFSNWTSLTSSFSLLGSF